MATKLFAGRKKRRSPRIEIIPMVDVMFLLLVFYILSSLALHNQKGIPVNLPGAHSGEAASSNEELVMTITATGDYYLNKNKVPPDKLGDALQAWSTGFPGGPEALQKVNVTLNADLSAQHRYVVTAMDELRKVGIVNFTISTEPGGSKP